MKNSYLLFMTKNSFKTVLLYLFIFWGCFSVFLFSFLQFHNLINENKKLNNIMFFILNDKHNMVVRMLIKMVFIVYHTLFIEFLLQG